MTGEEVRKLKDEELKAELGRLRTKLFDLRSQTVTEKVENTAQFTVLRRDVARLLTEQNSRLRGPSGSTPAAEKPAKKTSGKRAAKPAAKTAEKPASKGAGKGSSKRVTKSGAKSEK